MRLLYLKSSRAIIAFALYILKRESMLSNVKSGTGMPFLGRLKETGCIKTESKNARSFKEKAILSAALNPKSVTETESITLSFPRRSTLLALSEIEGYELST